MHAVIERFSWLASEGEISWRDFDRDWCNTKEFIEMLKENKIKRIIMLTGDNKTIAKAIASQAGISEVMANLLPEDKLNVIKNLKAEKETVAMAVIRQILQNNPGHRMSL